MATNKDYEALQVWFDGEGSLPDGLQARIETDADLRAEYEELQTIREAIRGADTPRIEDAQFRVFMDGIREEIQPQPQRGGLFQRWLALASMAAASFFIALSVFYIGWGDPAPVRATEVESVETELEGATTDWYDSANGTTTIWVNMAEDDL